MEVKNRMARRKHVSLRGLVSANWEQSGRSRWDAAQTIRETERADQELARRGLDPAPTFRAKRLRADDAYVRTWTLGCHFPWLNAR